MQHRTHENASFPRAAGARIGNRKRARGRFPIYALERNSTVGGCLKEKLLFEALVLFEAFPHSIT